MDRARLKPWLKKLSLGLRLKIFTDPNQAHFLLSVHCTLFSFLGNDTHSTAFGNDKKFYQDLKMYWQRVFQELSKIFPGLS